MEDDKFISQTYSEKLNRAGFKVSNAYDGIEAMEKIKSKLPDLIILDIILPEKNGFKVLEEIKNNPEFKGIPVIILSNLGREIDIHTGMDLGADDFLIKSNFSVDEVIKKIKKLI